MKPKIYILVGNIAAGKSTYCKQAARKGFIICNDDAVVNAVHCDDYTLYDKSLKLLYKSIEHQILIASLAMGRSVIVDRGLSMSLSGRKRWLSLAESFDIACDAVIFPMDLPAIHAQRRWNSDPRGHDLAYWTKVAELFHKKYIRPSQEEGFANVYDITFEWIQSGGIICGN